MKIPLWLYRKQKYRLSQGRRRKLPDNTDRRALLSFVEDTEWEVSPELYVEAFNREIRGLRDKTEVWCHTCWGNPFAQNLGYGAKYKPVLPYLEQLDVDVLTFEMKYADFLNLTK